MEVGIGVVIYIIAVVLFVVIGFFVFLLIMQERAVKAGNENAKLFDFFKKNKKAETKTTSTVDNQQNESNLERDGR